MVKSLINSSVDYPENKTLYDEDKEYEASMYKVDILDEDVTIALGQAKYSYIDKNILFYPIYLIKNSKVDVQIGVYEIAAADAATIIDEEGDVDVGLMEEPILFPFVSKALLLGASTSGAETGAAEAGIIFLNEQTLADAVKEREAFKDSKTLIWIQKFMKNNHYKIVDNEGKGDCLFAAIRDGLKMAGINTSVDDMRKTIAANATNEIYLNYKNLYEASISEEKMVSNELKLLTERHNELKKQIKLEKDRNTQLAIVAQAEEIGIRHKELKQSKATAKAMIDEFKFIKGIKDLDMFKLKLQTCDFWGDTWAISTLERALKIKLILLSRRNFKGDDLDNVLTCGQLNDDENANFTPEHYIILDYNGSHYQLITYKDRGAFTFKELPYDIKTLVVDKCLEKQAGPYAIIPDFMSFMAAQGAEASAQTAEGLAQTAEASAQTQAEEALASVSTELQSDLYEKSTTFQFYSKSLDSAAPGKGAGESIGPEGPKFYSELSKIPSWRRKLDNDWPSDFTLDGKKWATVEHYYQGSKFKRGNPNFYSQFSVDSGSAISKDIDMAEAAASKNGKYKGELIRPKDVIVDKDFFEVRDTKNNMTRSSLEMQAAMMAKFSQNDELKRLLKATKKAKLNHFVRGAPPELYTDLMIVRANNL